jgi:uridine kinase
MTLEIIVEKIKSLECAGDNSHCIIFIAGKGGSGKSTFAKLLQDHLSDSAILNLDDYRLSRTKREKSGLLGSNPSANKVNLIIEHLENIKRGEKFDKPFYDIVSGACEQTETYTPLKYNLIDGELCLHTPLIQYADYIIFINTPLLKLFYRRLKRDLFIRKYKITKSLTVFWQSNIIDFNKYYKKNITKVDMFIKNNITELVNLK